MLEVKFGVILKKLRTEKGYTQEKLAELAEIDRTYVQRLEYGLRVPSLKITFKLADALEITPAELVDILDKARKNS